MSENVSLEQLLTLINERDQKTQQTLVCVTEKLGELATHIAVSIEDKKHDDEFKKETRSYMKESTPLLLYVKEHKTTMAKVRTSFIVSVMFALLGLAGFSLK